MTPTDKLRALLDERGIEHDDNDANTEVTGVRITRWKNGGKRDVRYEEWRNGTTRLDAGNVSPEQAIAATVGGGTCHKKWRNGYGFCSECGCNITGEWAIYCPNCGRKVVTE